MKRSILWSATAIAAASLLSAPVSAETVEETAARFGAMPTFLDISLSPSGSKIAYIQAGGTSVENLLVVDMAANGTPQLVFSYREPNSDLVWCKWATEDRLVCQIGFKKVDEDGVLLGFSRLIAVGADGTNPIQLTAQDSTNALGLQQNGGYVLAFDLAGKPDKILMTRDWVEETSTGTRLANTDEGLGVEEVDVRTGRRLKVDAPDRDTVDYTADDRGAVRLKVRQESNTQDYLKDRLQYFYRGADSDKWIGFKGDDGFSPEAVDAAKNVAYGFVSRNGHQAVETIALDGTNATQIVLARGDADVDELIRIGRQRRVVGVSYATEKRQVAYLDPDLTKLAGQLQRALPGTPLVDIIDASADETKLLLMASSDTDPGMTYLFDRGAHKLTEVLPWRAELHGQMMAKMTPVSFPAGDGTMIPGYLTLPPGSDGKRLPAIVLPHGGPDARDEWGFDWLVQFFVARGYAVLQPNFRGSTGYGDAWFGQNGFKAWKTAIGDVDDAGRWLVAQGIAAPDKLAIVGWSYGGYAALQSQVLDNKLYKAVVAIAPVTDLGRLVENASQYVTYQVVKDQVGTGPQIEEGSPARNAKAFAAPVLLFHGTLDQNVPVEQSRLMKQRLEDAGKQVTYVEFDGRSHQLADASARTQMLTDIDRFLAKTLGAAE
ncbi:MAG: S9 family peptidase [Novosphingobium sp.]|nr:S9 family peptidase [Novosphingobium sp.]MBO9602957.1 S9 family peptidase [Novosphingobium sp.]